ncbi:MAG: type II toxin-antitoxin system death-on-curing family toxin [Candidatus Aenigmarchaeota archaeon]|nr:type II toxin-antitoxin system death-on-curing family toxin [Candidatus Aenigmarchaeota archaeon]
MDTTYLETEEIVKIHNEIIEKSGGYTGIINYGNLDFVVSQMKTTEGLTRKTAILLFGIVAKHPFVDGNKRTGLISAETFLRLNGRKVKATDKDIWVKLHKISQGEMNISQITNWLEKTVK